MKFKGRGVQRGDVVVVNLSVSRRDKNEPVLSKHLERVRVDTDAADETLMHGFFKGIEGMEVGNPEGSLSCLQENCFPSFFVAARPQNKGRSQ